MTDLELLERAAKVAGIKYDPEASKPHPKSGAWFGLWLTFDREPTEYDRRRWNPLKDDGDALRLAVKLGLRVDTPKYAGFGSSAGNQTVFRDGCPYAQTREAIVRAAAALADND